MKVVEIKHRKHLLQARQKTPSNEIPDYDDWIE